MNAVPIVKWLKIVIEIISLEFEQKRNVRNVIAYQLDKFILTSSQTMSQVLFVGV